MGQYYLATILGSKYCVMSPCGMKLTEHSYINNIFVRCVESLMRPGGKWHMGRLVWSGDYADPEEDSEKNLWSMELKEMNEDITEIIEESLPYVVNHDKKLFVDVYKTPKCKGDWEWQYHPLPLLCAEGNGRGGGDYRGDSPLVGSWARDRISCESMKPGPEYKELVFNLSEDDY